jgi:hypothetical protein
MAFTPATFAVGVDTLGGGSLRIHFYEHATDNQATVTSAGYIPKAARLGLRVGDIIIVKAPNASAEAVYVAKLDSINAAGAGTLVADFNVDIRPAPGTHKKGVSVIQSGPTSGSHGSSNIDFNSIDINSDQTHLVGASTTGFRVTMRTGGPNAAGSKVAFVADMNLDAPGTGAARDHIGAVLRASGLSGDGGTNTTTNAIGTIYGFNPSAILYSGALNLSQVSGAEWDVGINTGASAKYRIGSGMVGVGNIPAASLNAAYSIGSTGAGAEWKEGIHFHNLHSGPPIATDGTIMGTDGTVNTVANCLDFSSYNFTGNIFNFPTFRVEGPTGNIVSLGRATIGGTANVTYKLEVMGSGTDDGARFLGGSSTTSFRLDSARALSRNHGWRTNHSAVGDHGLYQSTAAGGDPFAGNVLIYFDGTPSVFFPNSIATTAAAANAYIDNAVSNQLKRSTSSLRYKKDVETVEAQYADAILDLDPIWYRSTAEGDNPSWSWYGLGAEDVAKIDPRLVHWTYPDTAYEDVIIEEEFTIEDTEEVTETVTETVIENGRAMERRVTKTETRKKKVELLVFDENGEPVMAVPANAERIMPRHFYELVELAGETETVLVDGAPVVRRKCVLQPKPGAVEAFEEACRLEKSVQKTIRVPVMKTEVRKRGIRRLKPGAKMVPDGVQYDRLAVLLLSIVKRRLAS